MKRNLNQRRVLVRHAIFTLDEEDLEFLIYTPKEKQGRITVVFYRRNENAVLQFEFLDASVFGLTLLGLNFNLYTEFSIKNQTEFARG